MAGPPAEAKTIAREGARMGGSQRSHQLNEQGRSNPVWIKRDLVLMGELALAIKRPELVSSCSPTFKRYWDEFAACIDRTEIP